MKGCAILQICEPIFETHVKKMRKDFGNTYCKGTKSLHCMNDVFVLYHWTRLYWIAQRLKEPILRAIEEF